MKKTHCAGLLALHAGQVYTTEVFYFALIHGQSTTAPSMYEKTTTCSPTARHMTMVQLRAVSSANKEGRTLGTASFSPSPGLHSTWFLPTPRSSELDRVAPRKKKACCAVACSVAVTGLALDKSNSVLLFFAFFCLDFRLSFHYRLSWLCSFISSLICHLSWLRSWRT